MKKIVIVLSIFLCTSALSGAERKKQLSYHKRVPGAEASNSEFLHLLEQYKNDNNVRWNLDKLSSPERQVLLNTAVHKADKKVIESFVATRSARFARDVDTALEALERTALEISLRQRVPPGKPMKLPYWFTMLDKKELQPHGRYKDCRTDLWLPIPFELKRWSALKSFTLEDYAKAIEKDEEDTLKCRICMGCMGLLCLAFSLG